MSDSIQPSNDTVNVPDLGAQIRRRIAQVVGYFVVYGLILFASSGHIDWSWAWVYLGVNALQTFAGAAWLLRVNPEVVAERSRKTEGAKRWDVVLTTFIGVVFPVVTMTVSGLDERFAWSPNLPIGVHCAALSGMVLGYSLVTWSMSANRFFAPFIGIQKQRGHTAVMSGPYRFVRHPGYVGLLLCFLCMPLALGSLFGTVPAVLTAALLIVRTALEDRTLQRELQGYADYAKGVRYRLIPGIW
jgi:protein-S-isoprenylcysteine O-methyltransferase Ste14